MLRLLPLQKLEFFMVFKRCVSHCLLHREPDVALPAVEIKDAPRFGYRGAHFDVSRHFFTIDEVKTYIDMLTLHNMNRLHWHITDDQGWRLEIKNIRS